MNRFRVFVLSVLLVSGVNVQAQVGMCAGGGTVTDDGICTNSTYGPHAMGSNPYDYAPWKEQEDAQRAANQRREQEARNQAIRNADYWGAIADSDSGMSKAQNHSNATAASEIALKYCTSDGSVCNLVTVFKNTCAYVTKPKKPKKTYFIGKDKDPNIAYNSAWKQCENKYGSGNCIGGLKPTCSGFAENGKGYQDLGF